MQKINNAKSYLRQLKGLDDLIDDKQKECDMLYDRLTKVTTTLQLVPVSGGCNNDSLGEGIVKLQSIRDEINAEIDCYADLKKEINDTINNVRNEQYRKVLRKRYVLFETWEQIAFEMGCSYQWVHKLHGGALQVIDKMLFPKKDDLVDCN